MARLKINRTDGTSSEHEITPSIEYAFEQHFKKGFHKAFRDDEMQGMVYWLAYECIRKSGEIVPLFGIDFLDTLKSVDVLDSDPLV